MRGRLRTSQNDRGFTIVELLIVIIVIGILATLILLAYNNVTKQAQTAKIVDGLKNISSGMESYYAQNATYPSTITDAGVNAADASAYSFIAGGSSYCIDSRSGSVQYYMSNIIGSPMPGTCGPTDCPTGFVPVPANTSVDSADPNGFCLMKYEAKDNGSGVAVSVAAGKPWVTVSRSSATTYSTAACSGCHLPTEPQWMSVAASIASVAKNWSGGAVGSGYVYSGYTDNATGDVVPADTNDANGYYLMSSTSGTQRRTLTLSNGSIIWDFAGNAWEYTSLTLASGQEPGLSSDSSVNVKEWNNSSLLFNGLPATSRPSIVSAQAATWSSAQGIGKLSSNYNDTSGTTQIRRGGARNNSGGQQGIFSMEIFPTSETVYSTYGFRVAR